MCWLPLVTIYKQFDPSVVILGVLGCPMGDKNKNNPIFNMQGSSKQFGPSVVILGVLGCPMGDRNKNKLIFYMQDSSIGHHVETVWP